MFKRALSFLVLMTLLTSLGYAQIARDPSRATVTHIRSNFSNIGVTGLDVFSNPGYIALTGVSTAQGYTTDYYLWVSEQGNLCIASWATMQAYASFPNGSWATIGTPCPKVGAQ